MSTSYIKLKNKLNIAAKAYYLLGEEVMDDLEYDMQFMELLIMEDSQGFADADSPSQKVGYTGLTNEQPHKYGRMLSLDNVTTKDELVSFFKGKISNTIVMPKLDGLAMALYYDNGILVKALLRGDGADGADVTDLALQMSGVPIFIDLRLGFRIVGEIVTFLDIWVGDYKNHRNYVSGSMNKVATKDFKARALSFVAFDTSLPALSFFNKLEQLRGIQGIIVVESLPDYTADDQLDLRNEFKNFFPHCDGLVYAQDDLSILPGATSHHPYNKVAFKFPEEKKLTKLVGVVWEMGRTKTLTPVGIMEPVILDGATVTRASLSNLHNIERRGIAINDIVVVHKAKEIIPQILYSDEEAEDRIKITITKCPNCLHDVSVSTTGIVSCTNLSCGGSAGKTLNHFCKAVGIKGIGAVIAEALVVNMSIIDVLHADDSDLCDNSSIAEANAPKAVDSILESFKQPRWKAWVGLGIPLCGKSLCEKLAVTSLLDLSYEKLIAMPKIADVTATKIMAWIVENVGLIEEIEDLYTVKNTGILGQSSAKMRLKTWVVDNAGLIEDLHSLDSVKKIYITGTLSKSRAKMQPLLLEKGFVITTSLSRNTDVFLAGKGARQHKIDKARELGIVVIYEKDL